MAHRGISVSSSSCAASRLSTNILKKNAGQTEHIPKSECKVMHLHLGNPQEQYRLGDEWIEISPAEKDMVPVDDKLVKTGQCVFAAQKANHIMGCIQSSVACKFRKVILPFHSALMRSTCSAASGSGVPKIRRIRIC